LPFPANPNVLVGVATSDDAGVYRLSHDLALVQTVDFFTPVVDDPFDFGRIAAANALSDIYAMGGTPVTALNIAAFPIDDLDGAILRRILEGGLAIATQAGVAVIGGHTIKDDEPKYGMAVTGTIHPDRIVTNATARPGDVLVLTKPLGTGILTTARKRDAITEDALAPAIVEMTRLNVAARDAMLAHGAHACTDITGFGLVGHAVEMARASHVGIEIDAAQVPLLPGVIDLIERDMIPGGTEDNLVNHSSFTSYADYVTEPLRIALSDAMTSGGLLIAATPIDARAIAKALAPTHRVGLIGRVTEDGDGTISIT
jgi:selenide,water dikinase